MKLHVQDLEVLFPYDFIYPEQYQYMLHLKATLDGASGHCALEMPTGTGKTVTLLSLILAYQAANPNTGKLVYCTRTVQEMDKVIEELRRVVAYRDKHGRPSTSLKLSSSSSSSSSASDKPAKQSGTLDVKEQQNRSTSNSTRSSSSSSTSSNSTLPGNVNGAGIEVDIEMTSTPDSVQQNKAVAMTFDSSKTSELAQQEVKELPRRGFLGVSLSSRRNLCIHPVVGKLDNREKVDALCRNLTASFVREKKSAEPGVELCDFYETYLRDGFDASLKGIYSLDDMKELGHRRGWCPYFLARHIISLANVVVYNYQYMLDPKISNMVSREIEKDSIVVFDEAHNIDNVCIEALSVTIDRKTVHASSQSVNKLDRVLRQMEATDAKRLNDEYKNLVLGLTQAGALGGSGGNGGNGGGDGGSSGSSSSSSSNSSTRLAAIADQLSSAPLLGQDVLKEAIPGNIRRGKHFLRFLRTLIEYIKSRLQVQIFQQETPSTFVTHLQQETGLQEIRALKFTYDRLSSLMRTLQITDVDEYSSLVTLTNFITLVSSYDQGFSVIYEPYDERAVHQRDPLLQLSCLDASLAIKPVFERFRNVIITSGTLSPLDVYPKMLNFIPKVAASLEMSLTRDCIRPMIVTKGADQVSLSSKFSSRQDATVIQNYGQLLVEIAASVPDGVVCFFTSYHYMESVVSAWASMKIIDQVRKHKLLFIETKDIVETTVALDCFKKACNCGRGAVFLSVARGKVAEGIDFDGHFGRCVLLFGVPFQYTLSRVLRARMLYLQEKFNIRENEFLTFDALRQASQCVGRVIRSKADYGVMIFADERFNRADKRNKLPKWIQKYLDAAHINLSADRAVQISREFLKKMAQPRNKNDDIGHAMLTEEQVEKLNQQHINV